MLEILRKSCFLTEFRVRWVERRFEIMHEPLSVSTWFVGGPADELVFEVLGA